MGQRILVIDDEPSIRWLLQELLEDEGYEVDLATDGLDALGKLDQPCRVYDVILLDLTMPRMDGLQFLRVMQQRALDVSPSIIALSADVIALQQAASMGMSNLLSKPFDLEALLEMIRLGKKRRKECPC
ncbi:MAG: response regulator [Chloroflexi bacterium]|nr:response regulator [Chloroflexota bacterium]